MAALWNRAGHYVFVRWFLISFFLSSFNDFLSSPILSRRRFDLLPYTSTHGVAIVRIYDADGWVTGGLAGP